MIGDLLVRLSKGERLSPDEQTSLNRWGERTSSRNAYVYGLQNGRGDVNIASLTANRMSASIYKDNYFRAKLDGTGFTTSIPNNTATILTISEWNVVYNYGGEFVNIGRNIRFPAKGYYAIQMSGEWDNNTTGIRRLENDEKSASGGGGDYVRIFDVVYQNQVSFTVYQNSGASLNLNNGKLSIRLISL